MPWGKILLSGSRVHIQDVTGSNASPLFFPNITTNASVRALVIDTTGNVYKAASDFGTATLTLNNGQIYVGNASNVATGVTPSGDLTLSNTGVFTIRSGSILSSSLSPTIINTFTAKTSLTGADEFLIGDSADTNKAKKITYTNVSASLATLFGDAYGAISSTDNAVAVFDGTSGKRIKNSLVIINTSGDVSGVRNFTNTGNTTLGDASGDTVTINGTTTFVGSSVTTVFQGSGSVSGDFTVGGNLRVDGDITSVNTTNLQIEDRFILLASGSVATGDSGIVFQQDVQNSGILFGYDSGTQRFGFTSSFSATATSFVPVAFTGIVQVGTVSPTANPLYGGSSNGHGTIFVDTVLSEAWIFV